MLANMKKAGGEDRARRRAAGRPSLVKGVAMRWRAIRGNDQHENRAPSSAGNRHENLAIIRNGSMRLKAARRVPVTDVYSVRRRSAPGNHAVKRAVFSAAS